jgi:hypothetical protein
MFPFHLANTHDLSESLRRTKSGWASADNENINIPTAPVLADILVGLFRIQEHGDSHVRSSHAVVT